LEKPSDQHLNTQDALAAVAVSTAAMAQVTISGTVTAGFKTSTDKDNVSSRGFGFDDSAVSFAVTEDLGNGMKVDASIGIDQTGKSDATVGTGSTLALTTSFGKLSFTDVEGADYLPVDGLTTNGNGTIGDRVAFSTAFGPVTAAVSYKDGGAAEGFGARNSAASSTSLVLGYTAGPLTAGLLYTDMTNRAPAAGLQSRIGFKAGYNFGMASVSYGQLKSDNGTNADNTETGLVLSVPMGAIKLDASYATSKNVGAAKRDGTGVKVSYALSKRTSVAFYTESYDGATSSSNKIKETSLKMSHSF
jgi:hypothetical protein